MKAKIKKLKINKKVKKIKERKKNLFFKKINYSFKNKINKIKKIIKLNKIKDNKKINLNIIKLKNELKINNKKLKIKNINLKKKYIYLKRKSLYLKKLSKNKIELNKLNNLNELKIVKTELNKLIINKTFKFFKLSLKKKKKIFFFKKLFCKKTLVKRMFELSFKNDNKLKNSISILKNNKKFKFLTFPINSICKFFFKNSMHNIFMTLIVLPLDLTIISYSGGHFNILSKRRDRGSINSLKSMSKIIALKIYQSNLSFVIFCPRLSTNNNKRLIKTIFYSFKILNRSPITKIYLYRPVIRNGIRSKKIPRK